MVTVVRARGALERQARRQMDDWRDLLGRHASVAGSVLPELSEPTMPAHVEGQRRGP